MADYQLTATSVVLRIVDGAFIPEDPMNADWVEYQEWLAVPNVPDPYVVPPGAMLDANARLDAGIAAAVTVAVAVRDSMQAIPDTFSAGNFTAMKIQLDALTQAFAAMLQAQVGDT